MKKQISKFLSDFDYLFGTQNFEKHIKYADKDDEEAYADITFDEKYNRIYLCIYPKFFEQTKEEQRKTLLHELCHTITIPSQQASMDLVNGKLVTEDRIRWINERETSQIENIIDMFLTGKCDFFKKSYKEYLNEKEKRNRVGKNK
jgi:hypothetical protein